MTTPAAPGHSPVGRAPGLDLVNHSCVVEGFSQVDEGCVLSWHQVNFKVKALDGCDKFILRNVSGIAQPGELLFVMGPSGSGKTTLLDTLADRVKAVTSGSIMINGRLRKSSTFRHLAAYVAQEESLYASLTVRQTLRISCRLYSIAPEAERNAKVEHMIGLLGLESSADTKVGNQFMRGLSGGQRRRLSVGVELLKDPSILLLDEPTSGLDSASSFSLMTTLKNIASTGTTIIATIHQPSTRIMSLADKLCLLSSGQVMYFGSVSQLDHFLESVGHPIGPLMSPTDFAIDLINGDFSEASTITTIADGYSKSKYGMSIADQLHLIEKNGKSLARDPSKSTIGSAIEDETFTTSWWNQFFVLFYRNIVNYAQNPMVVSLRIVISVSMALFIGSYFWKVPPSETQEIVSASMFITGFLVFLTIAAIPVFIEERAIFVRERANGAFRVSAWMFASTLASILPTAVTSILATQACYYSVGLSMEDGGERMLWFNLILFFGLLVSESMMMTISLIVPDFIVGLSLGTCVFAVLLLGQGFFVKLSRLNEVYRYFSYLSFHRYTFQGIAANEFHNQPSVYFLAGKSVFSPIPMSGNDVLKLFDITSTRSEALLVVVLQVVCYRIASYLILVMVHKGKK